MRRVCGQTRRESMRFRFALREIVQAGENCGVAVCETIHSCITRPQSVKKSVSITHKCVQAVQKSV